MGMIEPTSIEPTHIDLDSANSNKENASVGSTLAP